MLNSKMKVSVSENALILTIRELEFGEMFGVEVDDQKLEIDMAISTPERGLIEFLRDGNQKIDVLRIHQGDPACAETDFKKNGFKCRKKIKF